MKILCCVLIVLFCLSFASALNIQTNYYVYGNRVLVEYYFSDASGLELKLPYDVNNPEVSCAFEISENKILKINTCENFSVKYITSSLIDKSSNKYYFITNALPSGNKEVKIVLPESAVLVDGGAIFPPSFNLLSNGRNIILTWKDLQEKEILVSYEFVKLTNLLFYIILILAIILSGICIFLIRRKYTRKIKQIISQKPKKKNLKEKKKKEFTRNLFEDEKRIVEYILNKKDNECWTKELVKDLEISKVKLSRKLRSLEQKGIIKRIPYGNENRIRLLK